MRDEMLSVRVPFGGAWTARSGHMWRWPIAWMATANALEVTIGRPGRWVFGQKQARPAASGGRVA